MSGRLDVRARIPNAVPHYWADGGLVYSSGNRIYRIEDPENPRPEVIAEVPWRWRQHVSRLRLADRALKNGILYVHRNSNAGLLVITGRAWWRVAPDGRIEEVRPPSATRPMMRGVCESGTGLSYVADYLDNPERGPVRVHRTRDLVNFEVAWEFAAGEIRHIHALIRDEEYPDRIWILTGDTDPESAIWYTDDAFSSVHRHVNAGQMSRVVDLVTADGRLVWGMDSPEETPFILARSKDSTDPPEPQYELPGPAYFTGRNRAGAVYFGTSHEPGQAVKDKCGHIVGLLPDGTWEDFHQAYKDWVPQIGLFYFPGGVLPENWLIFSQRALKPHEGCMTLARDTAWG